MNLAKKIEKKLNLKCPLKIYYDIRGKNIRKALNIDLTVILKTFDSKKLKFKMTVKFKMTAKKFKFKMAVKWLLQKIFPLKFLNGFGKLLRENALQ